MAERRTKQKEGDKMMTYTEIAAILDAEIVETALVTRPMGSWKWQEAFAVSYYQWCVNWNETKGVWKCIARDRKMSEPQIRSRGITTDHKGRPGTIPKVIQ